ncbi:MAG: response regulator transcription factor [Anaerolineaceae bacterium]|nr:response regulator transcription factor [Anaerolineaceae bacterium]
MKRILIIEDELTLCEKLAQALRQEGMKVDTALDGESGLTKAQEKPPDLLLLDIMLPGLDGISICRILRRNEKTAQMPILMLTARGMEVDKIIGLETGADDYVVKPFALGELLARVRALLRRTREVSHGKREILEAAGIRLNQISRRCFRNGEELQLSNKEFNLLGELMRNPNVVLSRDLLLTKVWNYEYAGEREVRTVDVHIRRLRIKLEENPAKPKRIVTVRGVGYRFQDA